MRLGDILAGGAPASLAIAGLCADSRKLKRGDAFFALSGARANGDAHLAEAIAKGAAAIISEQGAPTGIATPWLQVSDARAALAQAAACFFARQPPIIGAITGTSGKTSVAAFTRQIWRQLGQNAASLGTLGVVSSTLNHYGAMTTPDPIALHETLNALASAGVTHLALEASSHGLDQKRLDGVRLSAGAFTNLSRDHMDYHATREDYLNAKLRLFRDLLEPGAPAIIDADSAVAGEAIMAAKARGLNVFSVGRAGEAIALMAERPTGFSTRLEIAFSGRVTKILLPLPGAFQASNALVAAGLCIATGSEAERVFAALEGLEGAPGRLQRIGQKNGAEVFVDYAHKPDALEKALQALRPFVRGKLILVFGCGGDRDAGKRAIMGEIATRCADVAIVTDDNPRSEDPALIRAAILSAARGAREIGDRAEAISAGVALLRSGDALLIAGKGHETGQIIGAVTLPFSDAEAARAALGMAP